MVLRKTGKRKTFNIVESIREVAHYTPALPTRGECFKYISEGGFSAISFIVFVATKEPILQLLVSTLRVGKKEINILHQLAQGRKLFLAHFVVSTVMGGDKKANAAYGYFNEFTKTCEANNWTVESTNNHSKVVLMQTASGNYVLETSSNLNENPKMEQFSFENDSELFEFYKNNLFRR